ncbi:acetylcholinesterase-like [Acanthaster planci]|uniref:Carboxylic ester hydrolase n=1 Tax=Acanthaster planci TaxID=133434 RepID=A0A8B7XXA2_ACAPL|nr:acetylcholinesterase-like [Acanthaster planci]
MGYLRFLGVWWLVFCVATETSEDPPVVTTSQGRIVGTRLEFSPTDPALRRRVDAYLGIPYAEAPVGPLRFKPPVAKSWSGELQATKLGNRCPQPLVPFGNYTMTGPFDEDCLFLDVFVPQPVPPGAAVLVYIHGGGYLVGTGVMAQLSPIPTAAVGDVIVVTLNYRLGSFGFLSTNDDVIPGNMGLLDQRLALAWVRDNIQAFGGDPARVAIFGLSAGAASVGLHMVSPGSEGLFRGAILELLEKFGRGQLLPFAPVVDGAVIPADPDDLHERGAINDAVSIIGAFAYDGMFEIQNDFPSNTDEAPFVDSDTYDAKAKFHLALAVSPEPIVADAAKMMYADPSCADTPDCDYLQSLSQAIGDAMFVCPGVKTAKAFTKAGRKVYHYHMSHVPTTPMLGNKWTKATHGDDLIFVFGLPLIPSANWSFTEDEARMSIQTIKYWSNLAKTGNPNLSAMDDEQGEEATLPEWPLFTLEELAYKDLSPSMGNGRGIKAKECLMWNEFIPKVIQTTEAKKCYGKRRRGDKLRRKIS